MERVAEYKLDIRFCRRIYVACRTTAAPNTHTNNKQKQNEKLRSMKIFRTEIAKAKQKKN